MYESRIIEHLEAGTNGMMASERMPTQTDKRGISFGSPQMQ